MFEAVDKKHATFGMKTRKRYLAFVRVNVKMSSSTGSTHVTNVTTPRPVNAERGALYPVEGY